MIKIEIKIVERNINDLKPDPNQPRKKFDQESIDNLAKTYESQGIINPIEIDENNMIITGEIRWRAAKKAGIKEIECKLFTNIDKTERFERQTIENLHHNLLTSIERENAVKKLWESKNYETQEVLATVLGLERSSIVKILKAYNIRKESKLAANISTRNLYDVSRLSKKEDREKLIEKIEKKEIIPEKVREIVKTIKEIEYKAPEIKNEILKPKSEITLEEAKEIARIPNKEHRKRMIKQYKITKKVLGSTEEALKLELKEREKIITGKRKGHTTIVMVDELKVEHFQKIMRSVINHMNADYLKDYAEPTQKVCLKIMERIVEHLSKEIKKLGGKKWEERKVILVEKLED